MTTPTQWSSATIRQAFLDYFAQQGHTAVSSSSLVPGNDPTLLFTNAGMVQFKDCFLGAEKRDYVRAVSSQRCVRAGGKHNDLENVGYTARHHTFFEMLGNFSFGDYFKRDAIAFAWQFLTQVLGLPVDRLWVTVHISDDEAADIWVKEMGVDPARMSRLDEDNFWQMGDTGPCGPCTEIFYDHGEEVAGGPPGSENDDLDRFIEVWNLVFMQYERNAAGDMKPLPKPSIDTGMGLERIAAVMQGVHSNYQIDLFQHLISAAAKAVGSSDLQHDSLKVIADHIRSCAFLVVDGVQPGNEGRGYVLRRIIRRALRHGHKLGQTQPFFHTLVAELAAVMGDAYPELRSKQPQIESTLLKEEQQFARTLDNGMGVLENALNDIAGTVVPGQVVFQLYDTYGFPTDLTADVARERGFTLDMAGYDAAMQEQRQRARAAGNFAVDYSDSLQLAGASEFVGYEQLSVQATVMALLVDNTQVDAIAAGQQGVVVLDRTPFYAESGGQCGDSGLLSAAGGEFEVTDCRKNSGHHLHIGQLLSGAIAVGDTFTATVTNNVRAATARNHSATHLLHAALREVLGEHVAQQGSAVDSLRLRFDFSHSQAVSQQQLRAVEQRVNRAIRANIATQTDVMDMESAKQRGAVALFGEKYGDAVRVLSIAGDFSVELCGGTHVERSGDIGLFRISAETSVASGVRRIEAVTGSAAEALCDESQDLLRELAALTGSDRSRLAEKIAKLAADGKQQQKEIAQLKAQLAGGAGGDLLSSAIEVAGVKLLAAVVPGADSKSLRDVADKVRDKIGSGLFVLAAEQEGRAALVAGVTKDLTSRFQAGDLLKQVTEVTGGKGGGRPDMAQGSAEQADQLKAAFKALADWLQTQ